MKSDTPRTDEAEAIAANFWDSTPVVLADFARQFERELNEAKEHIVDLEDEITQLREANLEITQTLNNIART